MEVYTIGKFIGNPQVKSYNLYTKYIIIIFQPKKNE